MVMPGPESSCTAEFQASLEGVGDIRIGRLGASSPVYQKDSDHTQPFRFALRARLRKGPLVDSDFKTAAGPLRRGAARKRDAGLIAGDVDGERGFAGNADPAQACRFLGLRLALAGVLRN